MLEILLGIIFSIRKLKHVENLFNKTYFAKVRYRKVLNYKDVIKTSPLSKTSIINMYIHIKALYR
jgi:hypothetical protein